ncbi:MAG TPA: hypothetical protein VM327_03970 [Candidatus Thermoplasmatota archaeon]|nr:hypothetical protein [Candidatus Thermoplasmatota archaeon]
MARDALAGTATRLAQRRLRSDGSGQMMMLSAIVLLVGFVALAGMVARVNQLGNQTGIEARHAILDQVDPMSDAIDRGIATLGKRTVAVGLTSGSTTVTAPVGSFSAFDVGLNITGIGIPAGTKVSSVPSTSSAILSAAATAPGVSVTATLRHPGLALTSATTPTLETGIIGMLEQIQRVEAGHGLWMDWSIVCVANDITKAQVVSHLTDGTVWIEVRSSLTFPRTTACATALTG